MVDIIIYKHPISPIKHLVSNVAQNATINQKVGDPCEKLLHFFWIFNQNCTFTIPLNYDVGKSSMLISEACICTST